VVTHFLVHLFCNTHHTCPLDASLHLRNAAIQEMVPEAHAVASVKVAKVRTGEATEEEKEYVVSTSMLQEVVLTV